MKKTIICDGDSWVFGSEIVNPEKYEIKDYNLVHFLTLQQVCTVLQYYTHTNKQHKIITGALYIINFEPKNFDIKIISTFPHLIVFFTVNPLFYHWHYICTLKIV